MVEATGLEPTTSWSLTKRATKLRYASMSFNIISLILDKVKHFFYQNLKKIKFSQKTFFAANFRRKISVKSIAFFPVNAYMPAPFSYF